MSHHLLHVAVPSNGGPGERAAGLDLARSFLVEAGIAEADIVRVDVPGRGAGSEGSGGLRSEVETAVPVLQSGSLFGDRLGLKIVDAHSLSASEAGVIAELLDAADAGSVCVVLVSAGSIGKALAEVVKRLGTTRRVAKVWERDAKRFAVDEALRQGVELDAEAAEALVRRFGSDTPAIAGAIEQMSEGATVITADRVLERFRNRPDEPIFHYTDAVGAGNTGDALRRLADLWQHQHPLVILAALESDLKRRSLAAAAPDLPTFVTWAGARSSDKWPERVWRRRGRVPDSALRRALSSLVRADRVLKTEPEDTHRVTMERLTVALCRWYRPGGR